MGARKYSASMDSELLDEVERAAAAAGLTVSAFMAQAARDRVALLALDRAVTEWEDEHGSFTEAELAEAEANLDGALTPAEAVASRRPRRRRSA